MGQMHIFSTINWLCFLHILYKHVPLCLRRFAPGRIANEILTFGRSDSLGQHTASLPIFGDGLIQELYKQSIYPLFLTILLNKPIMELL